MLSRKEMLVAFDELLERLDDFAVADEDGIRILPNILLRGVTRLPISFAPESLRPMNFDLSEEQEMFVSSVERFAAPVDVEARRRLRLSATGYDRARWQQLAELGLIALAVGEDAGGMGGSAVDLALVAEAPRQSQCPPIRCSNMASCPRCCSNAAARMWRLAACCRARPSPPLPGQNGASATALSPRA